MGSFATIIDGEPVAKGRSRSTKRGHHYTPERTRRAEAKIANQIKSDWVVGLPKPIKGPIRMDCVFYMGIPKSASKKRKAELDGKPCLKKPDKSNLEKLVEDAINHTGSWVDDSQVWDGSSSKIWSHTPKPSFNFFGKTMNNKQQARAERQTIIDQKVFDREAKESKRDFLRQYDELVKKGAVLPDEVHEDAERARKELKE